MDDVIPPPPPPVHQALVDSFIDIAVGQTAATARHYLSAAGWKLDQAIHLLFTTDGLHQWEPAAPPRINWRAASESSSSSSDKEDNNSNNNTNRENRGAVDLDALFRPLYDLMYHGTFQNSKDEAFRKDKWLIVNVQSDKEFASHELNRDTWANESVANAIRTNFVFWQNENLTEEGQKVCTFYRLNSLPAVLLIDPITSRNMTSWTGSAVPPESLLNALQLFLDHTPSKYLERQCNAPPKNHENESGEVVVDGEEDGGEAMETEEDETVVFPVLPEEPMGIDGSLVCRVAIRLPDGRRLQRIFWRNDRIQLLWSFCNSEFSVTEQTKKFRLTQAVPGASKVLNYKSNLSFEESGIYNTTIMLTWD